MRFRETVRYELWYQARRPLLWLFFVVLTAVLVQFVTEAQIADARSGETPVNAPYALAVITLFGSVMALLPIAAIAGEAAARDAETRVASLMYTTPVGRGTYFGGRLTAALVLAALMLLAVPLAILVAVLLALGVSDVDPALLGPVRLAHYASAYLLVALPNAVIATAFAFALATRTRRSSAGYAAAALLLVALLGCTLLGIRFNQWAVATLLDPLGLLPLSELARAWGPEARRTGSPYLAPSFLRNRALWLAVAAGVLALTYHRFRFAHHVAAARRRDRTTLAAAAAPAVTGRDATAPRAPRAPRVFGAGTRARQLAAIVGESWRVVVLGWGGVVMLALAALVAGFGPEMMEHIGVPLVPVTGYLASYLGQPGELLTVVPPLLLAYYAGELVWRDRDAGLGEIAGAAPVPEWVYLLGRLGGLALAMATLQMVVMAAAVVVQLRMGHRAIEPALHLRLFLGVQLADSLLLAGLAVAVHVAVAHKYVGHLAMLLAYAFGLFAGRIGIEHPLLVFAADPGWAYTDMRGFGGSVRPWLTLELYWAAWTALLLVGAALLWTRGREDHVAARLRAGRRRIGRRTVGAAGGALALVLALGAFTFHNTNVRNAYHTAAERTARSVEYERRYRRHLAVAQPRLDAVRLRAELHPGRGAAEIRGTYRLVHRGPGSIDAVHVTTHPSVVTDSITLDRPATATIADARLGYHVLTLREPLRPGDTLHLAFTVRVGRRGFAADGVGDLVTANGTYLRSLRMPRLGYQPERELDDVGERRDAGLPLRARVPSLDDPAAPYAVALAGAERVTVEAIVGTDAGQRAVAPGALRRTWTERGRRYFHYATERPIRHDYALFSADYAVRSERWRDPARPERPVQLEVLHHPRHAWHVDGMLAGLRGSLAHLSATFGPYPYAQLRLVEHPGDSPTLHAYPINVSFEEGFALLNPSRDARGLDFPFAVVAHEVAHQWWGNQLSPAPVEGGVLLVESLAWYSAMGVVEHARGPAELERLVALMREAWLPPRAPADPPLLRASGWFLGYRKGPLAFYALREYVGAGRVDDALRRLLAAHRDGEPPLPTTRDLYRELAAGTPDSLRYLLHDLFAANTVWELATERVTAEPVANGMRRLVLDVRARKVVVDTAGVAREVPMHDLVEIGAFADSVGADGERGRAVYRRMHRIRSGAQRVSVIVPATATWAGVDPRSLLFDVKPADNVARVDRPR